MIMMISLHGEDKEIATIFETLKLFTQDILHRHIHLYSISFFARASIDLCAMPVYLFSSITADEGETEREREKEKVYMVVHCNLQG